jgi:hypothetical protein
VKFILLVEGWTEKELPGFLKRWLDPQLPQPVGIQPVRLQGNANYLDNVDNRAHRYLSSDDVIAVFGLLDLYGLKLEYPKYAERDEKIKLARKLVTDKVDANLRPRFRQHFAVHEIEAWFLSDPKLFPEITLPPKCARPEDVNFDEHPTKLLDKLFSQSRNGRGYDKLTRARNLLPKLDPQIVYQKCPNFKLLMDEMLALARQSITNNQ